MGVDSKPTADVHVSAALAEARGLGRALALFPDVIAAAYARARQTGLAVPADVPATTEPAGAFDARRFGARR